MGLRTDPINVHPYQYLHTQKGETECMIADMLDAGTWTYLHFNLDLTRDSLHRARYPLQLGHFLAPASDPLSSILQDFRQSSRSPSTSPTKIKFIFPYGSMLRFAVTAPNSLAQGIVKPPVGWLNPNSSSALSSKSTNEG
ncbi:hypothetical protein SDJN02_27674, partial [Cucurbita argyrosperma subsp. argyrosperma]